jgi:hypothetical protein
MDYVPTPIWVCRMDTTTWTVYKSMVDMVFTIMTPRRVLEEYVKIERLYHDILSFSPWCYCYFWTFYALVIMTHHNLLVFRRPYPGSSDALSPQGYYVHGGWAT